MSVLNTQAVLSEKSSQADPKIADPALWNTSMGFFPVIANPNINQ